MCETVRNADYIIHFRFKDTRLVLKQAFYVRGSSVEEGVANAFIEASKELNIENLTVLSVFNVKEMTHVDWRA